MKKVCILFLILGMLGCASLPKATVEMSNLLEQQIDILQNSNLDIIDSYFNEKENNIIIFLNTTWYPAYLEMLFAEEYINSMWEEAVNTQNKDERMEILKALTQVAQERYMRQKDSLILPLQQARKDMQTLIINEYQKAKTMNSSITNNISQIQQIQEERKKYMSKIIDMDKIDVKMQKSLGKVDSLFQNVQKWVNSYEDNKDKIDKVINTLKK